ncbi:MAG TPA: metallophosphoesterase [Steroidobacteraceae bacterium]
MFVVSDPHAISNPERYHASSARNFGSGDPHEDAFVAVADVVRKDALKAEVLLCPGDLADGNDQGPDVPGMTWAWDRLQDLGAALGARVVATAGNHDIYRAPPGQTGEPARFLRDLRPPFPTADADESEAYFADDFVVVRERDWQVVTLNTCAEHDIDHERGSVRYETVERIASVIQGSGTAVNVLQCHHHPVQWTHLNRSDRDHMRLGERLLNMLDLHDAGRWIIVHGHRHIPAVGYVGESTSGPVRFSAGSVSCALLPDIGIAARNQFYMLEFDIRDIASLDLPGGGRFVAWDWIPTLGVRKPTTRWALPHRGGFGYRRTGHELARRCQEIADHTGHGWLAWSQLIAAEPRMAYVAPVDLRAMAIELERAGGAVLFGDDGTIDEVHVAA